MCKYPAIKAKLFSMFLAVLIFSLISCSDTEPKVNYVTSYVVMDFQDDKSVSECKACVFMDVTSDVRRVSRITLESKESGLKWTDYKPDMFSAEGRSWAGCSSFVFPSTEGISGNYIVDYYDALERTAEKTISIVFPQELANKSISGIEEYSDFPKTEKYMVLDEENQVIYYGQKRESWTSDDKIFDDYGNAYAYRKCYVISGLRTICVLPPVYRKNK